jgi:hypothetical protein
MRNETKTDYDLRVANMKAYIREPNYRILGPMKNAYNAEAFAITIEPKGGSATPTTEAMVALGNL